MFSTPTVDVFLTVTDSGVRRAQSASADARLPPALKAGDKDRSRLKPTGVMVSPETLIAKGDPFQPFAAHTNRINAVTTNDQPSNVSIGVGSLTRCVGRPCGVW